MALYTMELRTLVNDAYCDIFGFDYPFYTDDKKAKEDFEELFINHFYYHEIGCETFTRWQQMLKARLMMRMPYYAQLYQTEWHRVKNVELMMTSKNVVDTITHELEQSGESSGTSETSATNTVNDSSTSSASTTAENIESAIADGVQIVNMDETNRTSMNQSSGASSGESSSEITGESGSNASSSSQNQTTIKETTTHTSKGDIGIQTPAYAITEWRKIIINLNEMLIHDLEDLFVQIY